MNERPFSLFCDPELRRILLNASQLGIEHLIHEIYDVERNEIIHHAKAELDDTQRSWEAIILTRVILEDALDSFVDADSRIQKLLAEAECSPHALPVEMREVRNLIQTIAALLPGPVVL